MARKTSDSRSRHKTAKTKSTDRSTASTNPNHNSLHRQRRSTLQQQQQEKQQQSTPIVSSTSRNTENIDNDTKAHQSMANGEHATIKTEGQHPPDCSCLRLRPGLFLPSSLVVQNVNRIDDDDDVDGFHNAANHLQQSHQQQQRHIFSYNTYDKDDRA